MLTASKSYNFLFSKELAVGLFFGKEKLRAQAWPSGG